jgi:hypothetical protein
MVGSVAALLFFGLYWSPLYDLSLRTTEHIFRG